MKQPDRPKQPGMGRTVLTVDPHARAGAADATLAPDWPERTSHGAIGACRDRAGARTKLASATGTTRLVQPNRPGRDVGVARAGAKGSTARPDCSDRTQSAQASAPHAANVATEPASAGMRATRHGPPSRIARVRAVRADRTARSAPSSPLGTPPSKGRRQAGPTRPSRAYGRAGRLARARQIPPNDGGPGRATAVHMSCTAQPGRPGASCPGRSDSTRCPRVAPAASHHGTDGQEALSAREAPREAGTPPSFIGVIFVALFACKHFIHANYYERTGFS